MAGAIKRTITMSEELYKDIEIIAVKRSVPISSVIKIACSEYIEKYLDYNTDTMKENTVLIERKTLIRSEKNYGSLMLGRDSVISRYLIPGSKVIICFKNEHYSGKVHSKQYGRIDGLTNMMRSIMTDVAEKVFEKFEDDNQTGDIDRINVLVEMRYDIITNFMDISVIEDVVL